MNWYKIFKLSSVATEQDIGIGSPPEAPFDKGGNNNDDDIPPELANKIAFWISSHVNEVGSSIIPTIVENTEPKISVATMSKDNFSISVKDEVIGNATATISFYLGEDNPLWQNILMDVKNKIKTSALWENIGIPYEKASKILSNINFDGIFEANLINSIPSLNNINSASFWAFSNKAIIEQRIKNSIISRMNKDIVNKNRIELRNTGKPVSLARLSVNQGKDIETNEGEVNVYSLQYKAVIDTKIEYEYSYPLASMTLQKENGTAFERLSEEDKGNIIEALNLLLEDEVEKIENSKDYEPDKKTYLLNEIKSYEDGKSFADYPNIKDILNSIPRDIKLVRAAKTSRYYLGIYIEKMVVNKNELMIRFGLQAM